MEIRDFDNSESPCQILSRSLREYLDYSCLNPLNAFKRNSIPNETGTVN